MKDLIGIAILVATVFGGTVAAEKILGSVRKAALTKAAQGLPKLSSFAASLTKTRVEMRLNSDRTETKQYEVNSIHHKRARAGL